MSEKREHQPSSPEQDRLKSDLLSGGISAADFLEKIYELDQKTPSREDSLRNIESLSDPLVRDVLLKSEDDKDEYFNILSLSYLHAGQRKGIDNPEARILFEQARDAAISIQDPDFAEWKEYLEAYSAYFDRDRARLQAIALKLSGQNREVVEKMIESLG